MALPVVKSALGCANFTETVQPYLYQLRPLPQTVFESITNTAALKQVYLDTNPLISAAAFSLALAPIFLVVSEVNRNYSQVDRVWSILPAVFNVHYAVWASLAGYSLEKVGLLAVVSVIWSVRLTFNYWRRGGYSIGSEDYRWLIIKNKIGQPLFFLFNVVFISTIQPILLFLITTPTYVLLLTTRLADAQNKEPLEVGDAFSAGIMLAMVVVSAIADQQQWQYQTAKHEYHKTGKITGGFRSDDLERGFRTNGLFSASRHPNFAAEQSVWVTLHAWSCYSTGVPFNWTGLGALCYLALFQGSTWLTELLSAQKYPQYKEYQDQVGMFFPVTGATPPTFTSPPRKQKQIDGTPNKDAETARKRYDLR